jgi:hypothetical protein
MATTTITATNCQHTTTSSPSPAMTPRPTTNTILTQQGKQQQQGLKRSRRTFVRFLLSLFFYFLTIIYLHGITTTPSTPHPSPLCYDFLTSYLIDLSYLDM